MKKIFFIFFLPVFFGCKKNSVVPYNTTIKYTFTSSSTAAYTISYTDTNGNEVKLNLYNSTWSKTVFTDSTTWAHKNNGIAQLTLLNVQGVSPETTGAINIFLNGKLAETANFNTLSSNSIHSIAVIIKRTP